MSDPTPAEQEKAAALLRSILGYEGYSMAQDAMRAKLAAALHAHAEEAVKAAERDDLVVSVEAYEADVAKARREGAEEMRCAAVAWHEQQARIAEQHLAHLKAKHPENDGPIWSQDARRQEHRRAVREIRALPIDPPKAPVGRDGKPCGCRPGDHEMEDPDYGLDDPPKAEMTRCAVSVWWAGYRSQECGNPMPCPKHYPDPPKAAPDSALESPDFVPAAVKDFAARGYERVNRHDPPKAEPRWHSDDPADCPGCRAKAAEEARHSCDDKGHCGVDAAAQEPPKP